ncbi:hypothetical protein ACWJKU_15165 [Methylocaldum sp. MU1018]
MKAFGSFLVVWACSGPATAQKLGPEPDDDVSEAVEAASLDEIDLEFSEEERMRLKELRAWLRQRNLERARAAAFGSGEPDGTGPTYRPAPPQLLHDARSWQGPRQSRLSTGPGADERVRNRYALRGPETLEPPRQQPVPDRQADVRAPSAAAETKARSRVRLVWTSDVARHRSGSR